MKIFEQCDDLGPEKILHLHNAEAGLAAILVVDNTACGPSIGGVRMAPDADLRECQRLARAMTLKNAAAGLPHGGGKAVVIADPQMPPARKESVMRAFAQAIAEVTSYIPGPDMGTNERAMAWVRDEIGRSVGLPREIGGIPLDEIGATGFGLSVAARIAQDFADIDLKGARIAIQGFGAVGQHAARFLTQMGARIVAVSDSRGGRADPAGLDMEALVALKRGGGSVSDHNAGEAISRDAIVGVDCDIWIPAARPDVIHEGNVAELKAKLVLEGANIPVTEGAEAQLHERGVLCVPDFIANSGGVICAAVEFAGGGESAAFATIEEKITRNTRAVLGRARERATSPRRAAEEIAAARVHAAMALRRRF